VSYARGLSTSNGTSKTIYYFQVLLCADLHSPRWELSSAAADARAGRRRAAQPARRVATALLTGIKKPAALAGRPVEFLSEKSGADHLEITRTISRHLFE
jgi:hypothetical protein